jgi:hypothetical protein
VYRLVGKLIKKAKGEDLVNNGQEGPSQTDTAREKNVELVQS